MNNFARSFAVVVKSPKFVEEAAEQSRKVEAERATRQARKEKEEREREDERRAREIIQAEKARERQQEQDAKKAAQLANLAKKVEQATLHKKYLHNLHEKARAEIEEATGIEERMDKLVNWNSEGSPGEASTPKRGRTSSLVTSPPLSKKPSQLQDGSA